MTEVEQYIQSQVQPQLRDGEKIAAMAYMTSFRGGGFVGAATGKGYFCALTDERLFVIHARLGAFKPLLECEKLEVFERAEIEAVAASAGFVIAFRGGNKLSMDGRNSTKHAATQRLFIETLLAEYGSNERAHQLSRFGRFRAIGGLLVGLLIAGGWLWYNFGYGGNRAEIGVNCNPTGEKFVCVAKHNSGKADATACWDLVIACQNGHQTRAHACVDVKPGRESSKDLVESDFAGLAACDSVAKVEMQNLKVDVK